jgi:non-canonical purine NTP pyrophosphatase (RdgB/HAM1 family)
MGLKKRKIVLASRNEDKLREMRQLSVDLPFEIVSSLDYPGLPEVIEDGTTVLGNASRKAMLAAAYTGEIAVADDTALQVFALNELPDVFSSRFAGPQASYEENAELLLELMQDVAPDLRQARFVTCAVWVDPRPLASVAPGRPAPAGAHLRWLHNPFARAIQLDDPRQEDAFFNTIASRREVWRNYLANRGSIYVSNGADRERLEEILMRLVSPFLEGGRPKDAPADHVQLPDTRIWTADPPAPEADTVEEAGPRAGNADRPAGITRPQTLVSPAGLPADAPGREVNEQVWLEIVGEGRVLGRITRQPLGKQGFGYDPIFRVEGSDRTLAEMEPEEKNAISHRGRALRRLLEEVQQVYANGQQAPSVRRPSMQEAVDGH